MEINHTQRGFTLIKFKDHYDHQCSIQQSSLATDDAIWFGVDDADPKIMASQARSFGLATEETVGWVKYPIPECVIMTTRMHLTRDQVVELLPVLQYFVANGTVPLELPPPSQPAPQHADMLQSQIASWKTEIARLQDLVATAEGKSAPQPSDLHDAIMRTQCDVEKCSSKDWVTAYKEGHRDARHAAAELVAASVQQDRQDAERLDWLAAEYAVVEEIGGNRYRIYWPDGGWWQQEMHPSPRAAIDAAIEAARKEPK